MIAFIIGTGIISTASCKHDRNINSLDKTMLPKIENIYSVMTEQTIKNNLNHREISRLHFFLIMKINLTLYSDTIFNYEIGSPIFPIVVMPRIFTGNVTNESMPIAKATIKPLIRGPMEMTFFGSMLICIGGGLIILTTNLESGENPDGGYLEGIWVGVLFIS